MAKHVEKYVLPFLNIIHGRVKLKTKTIKRAKVFKNEPHKIF